MSVKEDEVVGFNKSDFIGKKKGGGGSRGDRRDGPRDTLTKMKVRGPQRERS